MDVSCMYQICSRLPQCMVEEPHDDMVEFLTKFCSLQKCLLFIFWNYFLALKVEFLNKKHENRLIKLHWKRTLLISPYDLDEKHNVWDYSIHAVVRNTDWDCKWRWWKRKILDSFKIFQGEREDGTSTSTIREKGNTLVSLFVIGGCGG